jgi:glutamyl/glutaminyl-tRNA synthetase
VLRAAADARRLKAAVLIHAARIAATGKAVGPGVFEVLALLGKRRTVQRSSSSRRPEDAALSGAAHYGFFFLTV